MKKLSKTKLLTLLTLCFISTLVLALSSITYVVKAGVTIDGGLNVSSFEMVEGAEIRVGTTDKSSGIRFSSTLSKVDYDALVELYGEENLVFGTFIMPDYYLTQFGALNYANCFGAEAKYCWGESIEGKHRIQNIEGTPTLNDSGDLYTLKGSIIGILDENINVYLVAVSYVKSGDNCAFASTNMDSNKRSILSIAQNGLIKVGTSASVSPLLKGYVDRYVEYYSEQNDGELPQVSYEKEVYIRKSTGFVKDETKSGTAYVDFDKYNVKVEAEEIAGWTYDKGLENNDIISVDGRSIAKFYYDESRNNVLLSSAGTTSDNQATYKTLNNISSIQFVDASWINDSWSYQGACGLRISTKGSDWTKITFKEAKMFDVPTNTFSCIIVNKSGKEYKIRIEMKSDTGVELSGYIDLVASEEPTKYTFTIIQEFNGVSGINFFCADGADGVMYYIDNICWEKELYTKKVLGDIFVEKSISSLDFDLSIDNFLSTKFNKDEISNATKSATYTKLPGTTPVAMSEENGIYTAIIADNSTYTYEAKLTLGTKEVKFDGYIFGYYKNMIATFDKQSDNTYHGIDPDIYPDYVLGNELTSQWENSLLKVLENGVDGGYAINIPLEKNYIRQLRFTNKQYANCPDENSIMFGRTCTKLAMFIYSPYDKPAWGSNYGSLEIRGLKEDGTQYDSWLTPRIPLETLSLGWNYVEITLPQSIEGLPVFGINVLGIGLYRLDRIAFI